MTDTSVTIEVPGMEPIHTTIGGMKRAADYMETAAGKKALREASKDAVNLFQTESVAGDQLKAFIERLERLEEEKAGIAGDIKDIFAEAKGNGFDTKAIRKIIALRKKDYAQRQEEEAILGLYMQSLGMLG